MRRTFQKHNTWRIFKFRREWIIYFYTHGKTLTLIHFLFILTGTVSLSGNLLFNEGSVRLKKEDFCFTKVHKFIIHKLWTVSKFIFQREISRSQRRHVTNWSHATLLRNRNSSRYHMNCSVTEHLKAQLFDLPFEGAQFKKRSILVGTWSTCNLQENLLSIMTPRNIILLLLAILPLYAMAMS